MTAAACAARPRHAAGAALQTAAATCWPEPIKSAARLRSEVYERLISYLNSPYGPTKLTLPGSASGHPSRPVYTLKRTARPSRVTTHVTLVCACVCARGSLTLYLGGRLLFILVLRVIRYYSATVSAYLSSVTVKAVGGIPIRNTVFGIAIGNSYWLFFIFLRRRCRGSVR